MSWQVAVPIALSAVSTGMQVASAMSAGQAGGRAYDARADMSEFDAAQKREAKEEAKTQAAQEEADRLQKYREIAGANEADITARGVMDSASTDAITIKNREEAAVDISNVKYMGASRAHRYELSARQDEMAAAAYRRGAADSISQGNLRALTAGATGLFNIASNFPRFGSRGDGGIDNMSVALRSGSPGGYW